jgi:4-aminobutyrate aminotransferase-like enzyme
MTINLYYLVMVLFGGLILFWLLFEGTAIRITPPLTISNQEIEEGCKLLLEVMDEVLTLNL